MKGKRLTQTVADDITVDTTFVESALDHLKQKLKDKLETNLKKLRLFSQIQICLIHFKVWKQLERFFQQHFNYVVRI